MININIYISCLHFGLLPIYVKWTSLSSLNGSPCKQFMSCLIIFLSFICCYNSFICCFKTKTLLTYANSFNPDQLPHVAGSVVGLHGKPIMELSIQILNKF